MDCKRFEDILDLLSNGTSGADIRARAEEHLHACPRCRALYDTAGHESIPPRSADLTRSILQTTSGPVCPAAEEALCSEFDQEPEAARLGLVELHCSTCAECRELAAAVRVLKEVLPEMAEIDPGGEFTAGVLAAMPRFSRPRPRPSQRPAQVWARLIRRPLFAWEAAYAGTLLFALVFLNPLLPVGAASQRAFASARQGTVATVQPAQAAAREMFRNAADDVAGCGSSMGKALEAWSGRAETFLSGTVRHVRGRLGLRNVFAHRTFLGPLRLPGCEIRKTDRATPGDPV